MNVEITLYDPIVPSGAQQVMEWVRTSHESLVEMDTDFYKKDVNFFMLGPVGIKLNNGLLKGSLLQMGNV